MSNNKITHLTDATKKELHKANYGGSNPYQPTCYDCPFSSMMGSIGKLSCHRYPQSVEKAPNDWCGEHAFYQHAVLDYQPDIRMGGQLMPQRIFKALPKRNPDSPHPPEDIA